MPRNIYQEALKKIKSLVEDTILHYGDRKKRGYGAVIKSQRPIKYIHTALRKDLIKNGVSPQFMKEEKKLAGRVKIKSQDICVFPNNLSCKPEILTTSYMVNLIDPYGKKFTERTLSINIRSQLSSLANNFDTLYERTFAETLNLHLRCNKMCLGELYIIPVLEYDKEAIKRKEIKFRSHGLLEKYILAFEYLNNRNLLKNESWKYEKVCLMIVDFQKDPPKIFHSKKELIKKGYLTKNFKGDVRSLSYKRFVKGIIKIYKDRFIN